MLRTGQPFAWRHPSPRRHAGTPAPPCRTSASCSSLAHHRFPLRTGLRRATRNCAGDLFDAAERPGRRAVSSPVRALITGRGWPRRASKEDTQKRHRRADAKHESARRGADCQIGPAPQCPASGDCVGRATARRGRAERAPTARCRHLEQDVGNSPIDRREYLGLG